ncbi:hypothetical protein ABZR31_17990, partial [Pseudomonas aeruginosa]
MKVLFLVQKEQRAILDRLYDGIAAHCECDTRWLSSEEQADLRGYFRKHVDVSYALHRPHLQLTSPYPGCWAPYFPVEFRHDASRRQSAEGLSLP